MHKITDFFKRRRPCAGDPPEAEPYTKRKEKDSPSASAGFALDRDAERTLLDFLHSELERRQNERLPLEWQWTLNANFLAGRQNCIIDPYAGGVRDGEAEESWREQFSFNRIAPLMETRQAHLKKVDCAMRVRPRTQETRDCERARISTEVLRWVQDASDFSRMKDTLISWAELTGTAFVLSWWDPSAGEALPGGEGEETLYEGDLRYGLLTPYEVYPESLLRQEVTDQRSILIRQVLPVEDIYDLYGFRCEGKEIDAYLLTPLPTGRGGGALPGLARQSIPGAQSVLTYFERPSRDYPDGRMALAVGDTLLWYGPLPYGCIPLTALKSCNVPGQFFGRSVIETMIPLQRAYNGIRNRILDYAKLVGCGKMLIEEGSVEDDVIETAADPARPMVYRQGYQPPQMVRFPEIPSTLLSEYRQYASDMEYVAGTSQLMVSGRTPSGVTSGTAIAGLQQIDSTRLSQTGENIRCAVLSLARCWLRIYKRFLCGCRVTEITGGDSGAALTWCADDLEDKDVVFTAENSLLRSPELQKQAFMQLLASGVLTDSSGKLPEEVKRRAVEMAQSGEYADYMGCDSLQIGAARRENQWLRAGRLPKIGEFDDHAIHAQEHLREILQPQFELLRKEAPERAEALEEHLRRHRAILAGAETSASPDSGEARH